MKNGFVIQWKNKVNGRAGRGTKIFARAEAEQIAAELNEEYPDIRHEIIPGPPPQPITVPIPISSKEVESSLEEANETGDESEMPAEEAEMHAAVALH